MTFRRPYVDCRVTGARAVLLRDVVYEGKTDAWLIPAGFPTDFASVPRWATWAVPRMGPAITLAAIVHDWLCRKARQGLIHPVDADGIFRRVLREEGAPFVTRWLAWAGVRWGGLADGWHREGWWRTAPQLAAVTACALAPPAAVLALAVWGWVR